MHPIAPLFMNANKIEVFRSPKTDKWQMVIHYQDGSFRHFHTFNTFGEAFGLSLQLMDGPATHCELTYYEVDSPFEKELQDNTCRARQCKWNANDSCILAPRDVRLPTPTVERNEKPWGHLHEVPRSCGNYSPEYV